ncbi:MAG: flagellar biosynthesis protein FlhA [Candidatus Aureabacteria bacterium]|nr:flagellar biosynthesis protein FlhA [Candidatus Auribacterota bacterium]
MMTNKRFEVLNHIVSKGDFLLAFGIIGVLAGILIPVPPFFIDIMLAFNIGVGMVIIMVVNFIEKPLEFSVFPSLLLITTLLRIAMNVATTRKILLQGYAGEIIEAFGQFVVGGNYIVGAIIFIIILIIQIKVITSGTSRISEVAARFTLDALPGKQMTIDGDLNSGLITEQEARAKRQELSREADFYGAMDGASKFVRGDVTAGLIITFVNILGGLTLGMFYQGMEFRDALAKYTLLTIGDGLVAQIPSLVISVAAGLIVTRAGSSQDSLGKEMVGQILFHPTATAIGAGALFSAGLVPHMPFIPFAMIGLLWAIVSIHVNNAKKKAADEEKKKTEEELAKKPVGPQSVEELLHVDIMGLEIGYGLISLVDAAHGGDLLDRINGIRRRFAMDLGLIVPPIRIRDNMQLGANEYSIKIKGNEVAKGEVIPDSYLAMNPTGIPEELVGIQTVEPAFGLPATWVNETEKNRAETLGFTVVDASSVLATHLTELIKKYAHELLSRQDVQGMVDNLKKRYPAVVEDVIPVKISIGQTHRVLQNLLREQISIRNLMTIFEVIGDYAAMIKDSDVLTEYVRASLRMEISKSHSNEKGDLYVITISPSLEQQLAEAVHKSDIGASIILDPAMKAKITDKIAQAVGKASEAGISPVILTSPNIRLSFKKWIEKELPMIPVLSYSEISDFVTIHSLDVIMFAQETKGSFVSGGKK